jgi:hypothetical protein
LGDQHRQDKSREAGTFLRQWNNKPQAAFVSSNRSEHARNSLVDLLAPSAAASSRGPAVLLSVEVRGAARGQAMSIWTIILIILVIALLGGFSGIGGGPFYGTGYYGGGGLGLVIIILLILLLMGRI